MGWSGGFLTTDFTDRKDFTDGEKLPGLKIFRGIEDLQGFNHGFDEAALPQA
jgi:hypothetical protein